jgi:predicted nucleic acid-binding protein
MAGLTLDSGALIAFERQDRRVLVHLKAALLDGLDVTVPAVVVAEVWRGGPRSARIAHLLQSSLLEDVGETLAREAGAALARQKSSDTIDALVMASAARRGDLVLTTDPLDLRRLRAAFPRARVVALSES